MATIIISPKAASAIKSLPQDVTLIQDIWDHIEEGADHPSTLKPPAFPYKWPMLNFASADSSGQLWGVTVLARFDQSTDTLYVVTVRASPIPIGLNPDDFFQ